MAYLSRIQLNPLRTGAQRLLSNPQAMHAAVLGGIPPNVKGRVLWRDETSRSETGPAKSSVLVLTPVEPDWTHVVEQAGWRTEEGQPQVRSMDPLVELVARGRRLRFRLRANPVRSVSSLDGTTRALGENGKRPRGIRVAHRTAGCQLEWLLARTASDRSPWGFEVPREPEPAVFIVGRDHQTFVKGRDERHRVTVDRATFEGELVVTDPTRLTAALLDGIGGAKAYGCGLLTLAPGSADVVAG